MGYGKWSHPINQFFVPLLVLAPFALIRFTRGQSTGIEQVRTGLMVGLAFALYYQSLLLTDVVRSLLLFYVMPCWGTVLECLFLGRAFTRWRALALVLGMGGLATILGIDDYQSVSLNLGDWMALTSGVVFAIGALWVRQEQTTPVFEQLFSFFFFGTCAALALVALVPGTLTATPSSRVLIELAPWLLLMAVVFLVPVMAGIYWGSNRVDPGRLGILLQLEAVVGIGSAALLAGEPFGLRELIGTFLILGAGLTEVLINRVSRRQ